MIFPLDIDYIEVVRGTNDPRYGLHNIGGNINVATRQGGNYTDGRLTVGSFNTQELQAALGRESGGFAQNYFVAKQDSDGYRDHSKSEKYSLGGKWFYTSDSGDLKAGLIARVYNHDAESPGYLTAAELGANRFQSPARNANDGTTATCSSSAATSTSSSHPTWLTAASCTTTASRMIAALPIPATRAAARPASGACGTKSTPAG
jgi:iron complex outermembrane receptor protein